MSLGGGRGFAMTFSPLARGSYLVTEVGWAPLNRRAVTASATRSGTAALVGGQLTARTSLGRGSEGSRFRCDKLKKLWPGGVLYAPSLLRPARKLSCLQI